MADWILMGICTCVGQLLFGYVNTHNCKDDWLQKGFLQQFACGLTFVAFSILAQKVGALK